MKSLHRPVPAVDRKTNKTQEEMPYPVTYLYLVCFIVTLAVTVALATATAEQAAKRSLLSLFCLVALWALADFLSSVATSSGQMRRLSLLFSPSWALIPFFTLRATLLHGETGKVVSKAWLNFLLALPAVGCVWLEWSGWLHIDFLPASANDSFFQSVASSWQHAVTLYYFLYLGASGWLWWWAARKTQRPEYTGPARTIMLVFLPLTLVGGLTNGGLSAAGIQLPYLGSVFACCLACLIALFVMRRRLFVPETLLRRQAEQALQATQLRYQTLMETSPDAIIVVDLEGKFLFANRQALRELGYADLAQLQACGKTANAFMIPEHREKVQQDAGTILRTGQNLQREYEILARDGTRIPVEINATLVYDSDHRPEAFINVIRNLTERRQAIAQRRQLEAQVQHAQKLESLGVLAGGIAHDFNNLLGGVLGHAGLARLDIAEDSPAQERIDKIEQAAQRAAELTRQMLAYSGRGHFVVESLDLAQLVRQMMQLLEVSISKKIELRFSAAEPLPVVSADAGQVQQVVMNLITNASEAIATEAGTIELQLDCQSLGSETVIDCAKNEPIPAGNYVCLQVSDSGCGLAPSQVARIFDPFYTTKFTGRGLGLAAVLGIVHGHGGGIAVDSRFEQGTTFRVFLPIASDNTNAATEPPSPLPPATASAWTATGTILVIDDEEMILELIASTLETAGLTVLQSADGQAGLDLFQHHQGPFRAVILDLTMPKMDGREVYRLIREQAATLPVLITSGYCQEEIGDLLSDAATGFLQKPFTPNELINKLRSLLGHN